MATVYYTGNSKAVAQVETGTLTGSAAADTITATINGKAITYTLVGGDTNATAIAALLLLLQATTTPLEFQQITWSVGSTTNVLKATASNPGVPIAGMTGGLVLSKTGSSTFTQVTATASLSPSDPGLAANWLRAGTPALPQNGDDVILQNCSVPLLYNLAALAAVQFGTYTRWQSFTGQIGLPKINPLGFLEYLPTDFKFIGPPAGTLAMVLGTGTGNGPDTYERYNVGTQRVNLIVTGGPAGISFIGSNANNTVNVMGTSVEVATWPTDVSTLASAIVGTGGTLTCGIGVTFTGALTVTNGQAVLGCAPGSITAVASQIVAQGQTLTYAAVTATQGSTVTWLCNATITALVLGTTSVLDKSQNDQAMVIADATIDGDTCQVLDPLSTITWTNAASVKNVVSGGPFVFRGTRTVKVT